MFYGRKNEMSNLKSIFEKDSSTIAVIYGKEGIGKTTLIKNFIRNKKCVYRCLMPMDVNIQNVQVKENVFDKINETTQVVVIEELQNGSHSLEYIFEQIIEFMKREQKLMFILTSSSECWVENNMLDILDRRKKYITQFMKLKELSFVEVAKHFEGYSIDDCLKLYTVTGGIPGYIQLFEETKTFKQNICDIFLVENAPCKNIGIEILSKELRETSLYNTIMWCLANGKNKLNDLYEYLNMGRDKISVYLKNLMDRGVVSKLFSTDIGAKNSTLKGLYRICHPVAEFWYRYMYNNISELEMIESLRFYDTYISKDIKELVKEALVKVANEYMDFLNEHEVLPIEYTTKGRFWGKNGDIHIVALDDEDECVVAQCYYTNHQMSYDGLEELENRLATAKITPQAMYLFSAGGFDLKLKRTAQERPEVVLIDINQM